MDVVPNLYTMSNPLATSPQSLSIYYDQERSEVPSSGCGGNGVFSKIRADPASFEDLPILDDKIEDSNLNHFFNTDLINTAYTHSPSVSSTVGLLWNEVKPPCNSTESCVNLTLSEINMDNDMSFLDMFNNDADDNKLFSNFDFLTEIKSNASSSCHTPVPTMLVEPTSVTNSVESNHIQKKTFLPNEEIFSHVVEESKNLGNDLQRDYKLKMASPLKANFPPRVSQPPQIGIVEPVQKLDSVSTQDVKEAKPDIDDLKSFSHFDLCQLSSANDNYSNRINSVCTVAYSAQDMPPQTVPSNGSLKRGHETVKAEPDSTYHKRARFDSPSDLLADVHNLLQNKRDGNECKPPRERHDSSGSSHKSEIEDEIIKDMEDSDDDYDDFSDIDPDITASSTHGFESLIDTSKKQKQFFWQYNVQAKGPKGTRLKLSVDTPKDPHVLNDFEDPVFDECNTVVAGIRHGGKARKGDGNEITPNPRKLVLIGRQLQRLNKKINACQLGSDVPVSRRNDSRKEKNKLASRACRLKKKAQHEANKIKLHGLEEEHSQLNDLVQDIWPQLRDRAKSLLKQEQDRKLVNNFSPSLMSILNNFVSNNLKMKVATRTTDFVNSVIVKAEAGDPNGGLKIQRKKS